MIMATATKNRTGLAATISREKLQEGLAAVTAAVPSKATLPVLGCVLIEASERGLRLTATDLDFTIETEIAADVEWSGSIHVAAKRLLAIAKELPPAPVRISVDDTEPKLLLDCGRSHYKLLGLPSEERVAVPRVEFNGESVRAGDLGQMVRRAAFAASREESRPILNGVLWQRRSDTVRLVATNGHRLALVERTTEPSLGGEGDYIIPPKALDQIARLFSEDDQLAIGLGDHHLALRSDRHCVTTRVIEGPYPNYRDVIPTEHAHAAIVDRTSLTSAVRRCIPVASTSTYRIGVTLGSGVVRLTTNTPDVGEFVDEVAARVEGTEFTFGINAQYLLDALAVIGTEEVLIETTKPENALVFRPQGEAADANSLFLIMPLRMLD